jgi:uncharacterized membrane protein
MVGVLAGLLLPGSLELHRITRLIVGWNVTAVLYVVLAAVMMSKATPAHIRRRAQFQDEGQFVILALVVVAAVASLAAIVAELSVAKSLLGANRYAHIGLSVLTLLSSWAFTHTMFALHYAHDYYGCLSGSSKGGLCFPGEEQPDYGDFMYFAFVIGTSGQTADVDFTSSAMRRIGLLHCVLAFLFNTTVLALMINIAASMI